MKPIPWQLQIIKRSLKKREKRRLIDQYLSFPPETTGLELGCAQGILSYFLKQKGGRWIHSDLDMDNLKTAKQFLLGPMVQLAEGTLPFKERSFDWIVSLDYLEHLDRDDFCLKEIRRLLKPGGKLLLAIPRTGRLFVLHSLRKKLGFSLEYYGHKREGYTRRCLEHKLARSGFEIKRMKRFSGFLTELAELILNLLYVRLFSSGHPGGLRDGHIRPVNSGEFTSKYQLFKLYSLIYPLIWWATRIDKLFFFQRGYGLMVWAVKSFQGKENN